MVRGSELIMQSIEQYCYRNSINIIYYPDDNNDHYWPNCGKYYYYCSLEQLFWEHTGSDLAHCPMLLLGLAS